MELVKYAPDACIFAQWPELACKPSLAVSQTKELDVENSDVRR
jgi:hypothetical protein